MTDSTQKGAMMGNLHVIFVVSLNFFVKPTVELSVT